MKKLLFNLTIFSLIFTSFVNKANAQAPANDLCANATVITSSLGGASNVAVSAGNFTNVAATTSTGEAPAGSYACFGENTPTLNKTVWFTFVGDGQNYELRTDGGTSGDHQMVLYSGTCGALSAVACNEDISGTDYNSHVTYQTTNGTTYYLMVDGWDGYVGPFTLYVTNKTVVTCATASGGVGSPIAGFGNPGPNICPGDTIYFDVTGAEVAVSTSPAVSGFFWAIGTVNNMTAGDITSGTPNYFGAFAADAAPGYGGFIYNATSVPAGTYYFYPVVFGNATGVAPNNTPVADYTFDVACMSLGSPIQYDFLTSSDPLCGGAVVTCAQASAGTVSVIAGELSGNLCLGDSSVVDVTGLTIPNSGLTAGTSSGFDWVLSTGPVTATDIATQAGNFFGVQVNPTNYPLNILNDGSIPAGTYYITPVAFANATAGATATDISTYTFDASCLSIGTAFTFTILDAADPLCTVGLQNILASKLTLTPNPANEYINISGNLKISNIVISDINGKTVLNQNNNTNNINVSQLNNGIYFVKIITNEGVATKTFIKE